MYQYPMEQIPENGYILAYCKEKLVFEPYKIVKGTIVFDGCEILSQEIPRECHFFNKTKEYRIVKRDFRDDVIEKVYSSKEEEAMDPDLLFVEDVLIRKEYKGLEKLRIINRYTYSANDTLVLKNYRIALI